MIIDFWDVSHHCFYSRNVNYISDITPKSNIFTWLRHCNWNSHPFTNNPRNLSTLFFYWNKSFLHLTSRFPTYFMTFCKLRCKALDSESRIEHQECATVAGWLWMWMWQCLMPVGSIYCLGQLPFCTSVDGRRERMSFWFRWNIVANVEAQRAIREPWIR